MIPSLPSSMLPIRSWKTAITAAPAPRKTSASASVSERRDGVPPRVGADDRRHLVRRPGRRVRVDRGHGPRDRAGRARRRQPDPPDRDPDQRRRRAGSGRAARGSRRPTRPPVAEGTCARLYAFDRQLSTSGAPGSRIVVVPSAIRITRHRWRPDEPREEVSDLAAPVGRRGRARQGSRRTMRRAPRSRARCSSRTAAARSLAGFESIEKRLDAIEKRLATLEAQTKKTRRASRSRTTTRKHDDEAEAAHDQRPRPTQRARGPAREPAARPGTTSNRAGVVPRPRRRARAAAASRRRPRRPRCESPRPADARRGRRCRASVRW